MSSSLSRAKTTPENDTTNVTIPTTTMFFAPSFRSSALASLCLSLCLSSLSLSLSLSLFCVGFYISTPELRLLMKEKRSPQRTRERKRKDFCPVLHLGFQMSKYLLFLSTIRLFPFALFALLKRKSFCVPCCSLLCFCLFRRCGAFAKHATKLC